MDKYLPGTLSKFNDPKIFESYKQMIETTNGLSLNQICNITKLQPHMIQNWVKRGYIPHPINKKYYVKHLSRILMINALRECMYIEDINSLMVYINGDVDDESDDIISEEDLYKLFSNIIYKLDNIENVETLIDDEVKDNKLNKCLKVMVYAYLSSIMAYKSDYYLNNLERS